MMGEFIWTKHATKRANERKIPQNLVIQTLSSPDQTKENADQTLEFKKKVGEQTVSAIVKKNELGENIILSVWIDPPNPGTREYKNKQRNQQILKSSGVKKLWFTFLTQVGL